MQEKAGEMVMQAVLEALTRPQSLSSSGLRSDKPAQGLSVSGCRRSYC